MSRAPVNEQEGGYRFNRCGHRNTRIIYKIVIPNYIVTINPQPLVPPPFFQYNSAISQKGATVRKDCGEIAIDRIRCVIERITYC